MDEGTERARTNLLTPVSVTDGMEGSMRGQRLENELADTGVSQRTIKDEGDADGYAMVEGGRG